jgi:transposase
MAVSNEHGELWRERHFKRQKNGLRFQNKSVSRKKRGSGRWTKAVRELGRRHTSVADTRKAYNLGKAQDIAARSAIICVENLQMAFMLQNKRLSSSAYDLGWGQFLQLVESECAKRGHLLIKADRFDPTTQKCPTFNCAYKNIELKNNISIHTWACPQCGITHDRDDAASQNIQVMAVKRYLEVSSGVESVPGMQKLHPELIAFIARGGMTAFLQPVCKESRRVEGDLCPGIAVPIKREFCQSTPAIRMDREMGC